jgi:fluoroquinolone resistance protein
MITMKSKQNYSGQTFSRLDVKGTKISSSDFEACTFDKCAFNEAVLTHCRFTKCKFVGCDLSLLKPRNCRFVDVEFVESKLVGVDWTAVGETKTDRMLFSAAFDRCVLDYGVMKGLPVKKLANCSAREVDFTEADLQEPDCRESDFAGASFLRSDLRGANFVGARHYAIDVTQNKVRKARFSWPDAMALTAAFGVIIEE